MKKIIILLCSCFSVFILNAQPTDKMNYQAVARDAANVILSNQSVSIRLTIQDGPGGAALYQETHSTQTNPLGLLSLQIGSGTVVSGNYSSIFWANGNQWIKTEIDPLGGTTFSLMGESQLLSVPYSNYAAISGNEPYVVVATSTGFISSLSACAAKDTISITVPAAGSIIVEANVHVAISRFSMSNDAVMLYLSDTAATCLNTASTVIWEIPSSISTYSGSWDQTYTVRRMFTIAQGGTYTYFLNGFFGSGIGNNCSLAAPNIIATYYRQ
jgi:hypothetical protein